MNSNGTQKEKGQKGLLLGNVEGFFKDSVAVQGLGFSIKVCGLSFIWFSEVAYRELHLRGCGPLDFLAVHRSPDSAVSLIRAGRVAVKTAV